MAFESHQKVEPAWTLIVAHLGALVETKAQKQKLASLEAATSARVPAEHLDTGKVTNPEHIGWKAPCLTGPKIEFLLN